MKIISLSEFIQTGKFGGISLREPRKTIFHKLDIPETELEHFDFNNIEFQFNNEELVCLIFFIEHCGNVFEKSEALDIDDFDFFKHMPIEKFKTYCLNNALVIIKEYHLSQDTSIELENGVNLVFEKNKLTSIAVMDNLRI